MSVLLPGLLFGLAAWQGRREATREAQARIDRTVDVLHEHALKVFETHQLVIDQTNERLRTVDWRQASTDAGLHRMLKQLQERLDQVATITVADADGRMRASSRLFPADPEVSFADRDWLQALRERAPDRAYVSRSYTGRQSGQSVFNVADRVEGGEGFRGAISVSVDRAYFERFYQRVEPELDHNVALVRQDGAVLARYPATQVQVLPPGTPLLEMLQRQETGRYRARSPLDGVERIVGYRRIGAYPVFVSFGLTVEAAYAGWRRHVLAYGLVALLSAAALLALSSLVIRQTNRERSATQRWQAAAARAEAEMMRREQTEAQLRQSQKMEAVGQLTGGVAHDFNNLLTVVTGNLDMLRRRLDGADARLARYADNAIQGAQRAATLTSRLLAFSRQAPLSPEVVDANKLVAGMSDLLRRTLGEQVAIETVLSGGLWRCEADPNGMENALLNLAVNARDAMPEGGKLTIETANTHLDEAYAASTAEAIRPGQYVMVSVSDTGSGMTAEVRARVFEPFFTTKPVGKGTGLGLAQVYGFMRQSNGHAAIYSEPGHGTTVKLYFPRLARAQDRAPGPPASVDAPTPAPAGRNELVLVVEDDAMVREFSVSALEEAGYRVLSAEDGPSGLALLDAHPQVDLLFTDVVLAGPLNGRQLADEAQRRRPGVPVLFTTGYTRNAIVHQGRLDEGVNLLEKPFTAASLVEKVRRLLDAACRAT